LILIISFLLEISEMAIYLKVIVTARIKIQDPCNASDIEDAKEDLELVTKHELVDENYEIEVEDVN